MPLRELERIKAVNRFLKLEISKDAELQEIVELAARVCGTNAALITFLDADIQNVMFKTGIQLDNTKRVDAFCDHVVRSESFFEVENALTDERFNRNPLVTGKPDIRYYAGAPLTTQDGMSLGSLCVIDTAMNKLSELQKQMLVALAKQVIQLLEFDMSLQILRSQYISAKQSEIELRAFFESTIDHHLLLGLNFQVLAFNRAWESHVLAAYGKNLTRGASMTDYVHPANLSRFYQDYLHALKGTAIYDERNLGNEGEEAWRIVKFEPAFDMDGKVIGVAINTTDVNRRVKQEILVQEQHKSLEHIAFLQAHELRRPVATILGLMDLIKENEYKNSQSEFEYLEKTVEELDSKIKLVIEQVSVASYVK
ncbi:GAF domain-containing protein [Mucilaginibacter aquatilis]|uniref:histidine kinase n=1 Tax=Mucilaginibacter aquatilis TaxID=1517760 RepID=A0A6I4I9V7_9SPHI|nr:GAF domain-containing protein [Mucilaginibacter aquatilis]MVN91767.1 PAS domain S-box protein [Mucilaginibacter aquatilis]